MTDAPQHLDAVPGSTRGYLIAVTATVIWSSTAIFIGYLTTRFQMPPLVLAFWRDLIVTATLFGVIAVLARPLLHLGRQNIAFFAVYGLLLATFNALWTASVKLNGAAVSTVLAYSSPAFTALAGWRWWGERLDALKVGAVFLSIGGCVLVSGAYDPKVWQLNPTGIVIGLLSGVGFAAYSIMGKFSSKRGTNPWTATLYTFAFGSLFLLLVQRPDTILWLSHPLREGGAAWREVVLGWGIIILLSIGPTIGGYGLYTVSLTHLPAATANLIATLEPILTAILAMLFLGEQLAAIALIGGGMTLFGVVLLRLSDRAHQAQHRRGALRRVAAEPRQLADSPQEPS
ncbi:MAG: EamA family transporter [Chloroflexi bacterium]|nr:EamA family transporter [Chloroflexota bacterium]